jgi:ATP-dependent DNA helicase DinG
MASYNPQFIGLDIEATDLSPESGHIIEVAAVRFEKGKEVASYSQLINPGEPIPPIITSITGIRDQDVAGKPAFDAVRDEFGAFVGDAPIIGHNIAFDIGFLKSQGLPLKNPLFDTWRLATLLLPRARSHSLESLAQELKLNHPEAHRALHDARVGAELFLYLADRVAEFEPDVVTKIVALLGKHPYSLSAFFTEVFKVTPIKEKKSAARKKAASKKAGAKPQLSLPLGAAAAADASTSITPGWVTHSDHAGERLPKGELFDVTDLEKVFQKTLKPLLPEFELRAEQVSLTKELLSALEKNKKIVLEAPPGTGRREAALIATLSAPKKSDGPLFYSVAGQFELEQSYAKAVALTKDLGGRVALLDQPSGYIYLPALHELMARDYLSDNAVHLVIKLLAWLSETKTGMLSELSLIWEEQQVIKELTADSHACSKNAEHEKCSYCAAFLQAEKASLVIIRHGALISAIKKQSPLPDWRALVLDDAETLEETTTQTLGRVVHQGALERLFEGIEAQLGDEINLTEWQNQLTLLAGVVGLFVEHHSREAGALGWSGARSVNVDESIAKEPEYDRLNQALRNFASHLGDLQKVLSRKASSLVTYYSSELKEHIANLEAIADGVSDARIVQIGSNYRQQIVLKTQPVGVQDFVTSKLFAGKKAVVLMGPRLALQGQFSYVRSRLGLPKEFAEKIISVPEGLAERTKIIAVSGLPHPATEGWASAAGELIAQASGTLKGKIMVLVSSRSGVLALHSEVEKLMAGTGVKLLAQGLSGGRGKTMQSLARNENVVLIASYAFAERLKFAHGFSAIFITKLPFSAPTEPLQAARKKQAASGFMDVELPRVALKVREQFDRLVATRSDRGALIVLDDKFQKNYGAIFIESLPAVPYEVIESSKLDESLATLRKPQKA